MLFPWYKFFCHDLFQDSKVRSQELGLEELHTVGHLEWEGWAHSTASGDEEEPVEGNGKWQGVGKLRVYALTEHIQILKKTEQGGNGLWLSNLWLQNEIHDPDSLVWPLKFFSSRFLSSLPSLLLVLWLVHCNLATLSCLWFPEPASVIAQSPLLPGIFFPILSFWKCLFLP